MVESVNSRPCEEEVRGVQKGSKNIEVRPKNGCEPSKIMKRSKGLALWKWANMVQQ